MSTELSLKALKAFLYSLLAYVFHNAIQPLPGALPYYLPSVPCVMWVWSDALVWVSCQWLDVVEDGEETGWSWS